MPAPLSYWLLPPGRKEREIDNHYHNQLTTESTEELKEHFIAHTEREQRIAEESLEGIAKITEEQAIQTVALGGILIGTKQIRDTLRDIKAIGRETLATMHQGFDAIARGIFEQRKKLQEIVDILRRPERTKITGPDHLGGWCRALLGTAGRRLARRGR